MFRLQNKVFLCVLGSVLPFALLLSALGVYSFKRQMEGEFHLRTLAATRVFMHLASDNLKNKRTRMVQDHLDSLLSDPDLEVARVYDRNGNLVASKTRGAFAVMPVRIDPQAYERALRAMTPEFLTTEIGGRRSMVVYQRLWSATPVGIETLGVAYAQFSYDRLDRKIGEMGLVSLMVAGGLILSALLLSYILSARVLRPIEDLRRAAGAIGRGDFGEPLPVAARDEIGELARAFAQMSNQVQAVESSLEVKVQERSRQLEDSRSLLVQSEKMAAVGQLAAGLAHEINTPLGVMLSYLDGALGEMRQGDPLEFRLKAIERETIRCRDLVRRMLSFSRDSRPDLKEEVDLHQTVEQALILVTAQEALKRIKLIREFDAELPKVRANMNQIEQIVINLCTNALDAMPGSGTLTLRLQLTREKGASFVTLTVADTGAGIPKEIQSRIFEPYFTTKAVGKGTGLGLSIVYEMVQRNQGSLILSSEPGRGTRFSISFPVAAH